MTIASDELDAVADSSCSLREAVEAAEDNFATGGCPKGQANKLDVIKLGSPTYNLTIPTTDESNGVDGDLDFTGGGPLEIRGVGAGNTTIATSLDDRIIEIFGVNTITTIKNLEVTGGNAATLSDSFGGNIKVQQGKLVLQNVRSTNSFASGGGAIAVQNTGTKAKLSRVTVSGASAEHSGGAMILQQTTSANISRSVFENNEIDSNEASLRGGAIRSLGGSLKITDSAFLGNSIDGTGGNEGDGGAIYANSPISVARSLFAGNSVSVPSDGGAGGAIYGPGGDVTNTTFFDNDVTGSAGAFLHNGSDEPLVVSNSTFLFNDATEEGDHVSGGPQATIRIANSILGNLITPDPCGPGGTTTSKGYNVTVIDDPDCGFGGKDKTVGDLKLDPDGLEDNGGPTETVALKKASAAVNLVPTKKCKAARKVDQRGFERPAGKRCDAGAFERGAKKP